MTFPRNLIVLVRRPERGDDRRCLAVIDLKANVGQRQRGRSLHLFTYREEPVEAQLIFGALVVVLQRQPKPTLLGPIRGCPATPYTSPALPEFQPPPGHIRS